MSSPGPTLTAEAADRPTGVPTASPPSPPGGASDGADEAAVLAVVGDLLAEVIGEDYVSEIEIGRDTAFHDDLDIESIEFVALGELLEERYGSRVDFPGWIATMEVDDIIGMTVGQLVDHIVAGHG